MKLFEWLAMAALALFLLALLLTGVVACPCGRVRRAGQAGTCPRCGRWSPR